jgi:ubiquinone/menaquinone biosynthesis C-methylase UbiE
MPTPTDHATQIRDTFDAVADGYDTHALRFFVAGAAHMAGQLALRGDEHVLDVACGTGHVAMAVARRLPHGRVTAVDLSSGMLAHARCKAVAAGLVNIDFVEQDMQALAWAARFDAAVCGFGLFFVEDMEAQLPRIVATVKPGGRVMVSAFAEGYMDPLRSLMVARLERFGVVLPPQTWLRIARPEACHALFANAGLAGIQVERRNLGYSLAGPEEWWKVIWNAGFRRMVGRLSPAEQASFRDQHLTEIEALRTPDGIRMDVGVLFASGVVPGP